MTPPPWRPMDVPDDILRRSTRPDPNFTFLEDVEPGELGDGYDCAYVIEWEGKHGRQQVLWPMRLHVHNDECGRA